MMGVTALTKTRFNGLGIRTYRGVTRVGVLGHRKPFKDTWTRFVDLAGDADIGPSFASREEAFAALSAFASERGYEAGLAETRS